MEVEKELARALQVLNKVLSHEEQARQAYQQAAHEDDLDKLLEFAQNARSAVFAATAEMQDLSSVQLKSTNAESPEAIQLKDILADVRAAVETIELFSTKTDGVLNANRQKHGITALTFKDHSQRQLTVGLGNENLNFPIEDHLIIDPSVAVAEGPKTPSIHDVIPINQPKKMDIVVEWGYPEYQQHHLEVDSGVSLFSNEGTHIEDVYFHRIVGQAGAVVHRHASTDCSETISVALEALEEDVGIITVALCVHSAFGTLAQLGIPRVRIISTLPSLSQLCCIEIEAGRSQPSVIMCALLHVHDGWCVLPLQRGSQGKTPREVRQEIVKTSYIAEILQIKTKMILTRSDEFLDVPLKPSTDEAQKEEEQQQQAASPPPPSSSSSSSSSSSPQQQVGLNRPPSCQDITYPIEDECFFYAATWNPVSCAFVHSRIVEKEKRSCVVGSDAALLVGDGPLTLVLHPATLDEFGLQMTINPSLLIKVLRDDMCKRTKGFSIIERPNDDDNDNDNDNEHVSRDQAATITAAAAKDFLVVHFKDALRKLKVCVDKPLSLCRVEEDQWGKIASLFWKYFCETSQFKQMNATEEDLSLLLYCFEDAALKALCGIEQLLVTACAWCVNDGQLSTKNHPNMQQISKLASVLFSDPHTTLAMDRDQRLAFFLNCYHFLLIQVLYFRQIEDGQLWNAEYEQGYCSLIVDGNLCSLSSISGILLNLTKSDGSHDLRIPFALCRPCNPYPKLHIYTPMTIDHQLTDNVKECLWAEVEFQRVNGVPLITLPNMFRKYPQVYGRDSRESLKFVTNYVCPHLSSYASDSPLSFQRFKLAYRDNGNAVHLFKNGPEGRLSAFSLLSDVVAMNGLCDNPPQACCQAVIRCVQESMIYSNSAAAMCYQINKDVRKLQTSSNDIPDELQKLNELEAEAKDLLCRSESIMASGTIVSKSCAGTALEARVQQHLFHCQSAINSAKDSLQHCSENLEIARIKTQENVLANSWMLCCNWGKQTSALLHALQIQ